MLFALSLNTDYHVKSWKKGDKFVVFKYLFITLIGYSFRLGPLEIAENLTFVFQMVSTDINGHFISDLSIEYFGVSKYDNTLAMNMALVPFGKTKHIFIVDDDSFQ